MLYRPHTFLERLMLPSLHTNLPLEQWLMPPFLPLHGFLPRSAYAGLIKSVAASNASSNLDFMIIHLKKGI